MSKREVSAVVCLSPTEIDRREGVGRFPKRIRLGKHRTSRVVWRQSAIEKWMDEQEVLDLTPTDDNLPIVGE